MKKLFVSGFPLGIDEMELATLIAPHGDIDTIKIVRDKKSGKCKGYAFVEMVHEEAARAAALGLNGTEMKGRQLTVNINPDIPEQRPPYGSSTSPQIPPSNTVRISPRIERSPAGKPKRPRKPGF